jgi:hypothetical protein
VTDKTEQQIVEQHTVRSGHVSRRFDDGRPELGSIEYDALDYAERLRVCEERVGIFRDESGGITSAPPQPYGASERNPIDREDW